MLSGGERGRLALAKLALQDTNLLLLDEPTNHLDIPSQEVLEAVLDDYAGTILLVTHDRYLVDAIATQIWEIDPDESHLIIFKGTYSQMKEEREKELARQAIAEAVVSDTRKKDAPKAKSAAQKRNGKESPKCKNWKTASPNSKPNWAKLATNWKIRPKMRARWSNWQRNMTASKKKWTVCWQSGKGCMFPENGFLPSHHLGYN